jgi:ribosome-associated protein
MSPPSPEGLLDVVVASLDQHKAEDLAVIALKGKSSIADYMVIATGRSQRHVTTLAEALVVKLKEQGLSGITPEGARHGDWVLVDAGDVVVHIFRPEVRTFYNLEKMWGMVMDEERREAAM